MAITDTFAKKNRNSWSLIWLAYTGFLFIGPIFEPSWPLWLGTLAVFAVFVALFIHFVRSDDDRTFRFWMIGATFVLGLITFPWNPGASTFFIYAAAFLPFSIPSIPKVVAFFALESLAIVGETYIFRAPGHFYIAWPNAIIGIFLLVIIGTGNILFAEQKRADCKLRAAQEENVQLAAVAERERIARDLHDVLGHTLSVIVLKAELAKRLMQEGPAFNPERAATEMADVESTARTALAEVREAIGGYRSQGLVAELDHARRTLDAAGVKLTWQAPPADAPALSATEETVLSLSVREAVTNIVRHAEATHCAMRLATTPDGFYSLLVEDDGPHPIRKEGNGLRGMRERVAGLGGRFSIRSDHGTRLLIELPITALPITSTQQGFPA